VLSRTLCCFVSCAVLSPAFCRRLFPASQWSAEINAAIASAGFFWLVGESEVKSEPVEVCEKPAHFGWQCGWMHTASQPASQLVTRTCMDG
jgi:hypothetical protein